MGGLGSGLSPFYGAVLRYKAPIAKQQILQTISPAWEISAGIKKYQKPKEGEGPCLSFVDDKTLVVAPEVTLKQMLTVPEDADSLVLKHAQVGRRLHHVGRGRRQSAERIAIAISGDQRRDSSRSVRQAAAREPERLAEDRQRGGHQRRGGAGVNGPRDALCGRRREGRRGEYAHRRHVGWRCQDDRRTKRVGRRRRRKPTCFHNRQGLGDFPSNPCQLVGRRRAHRRFHRERARVLSTS